MKVTKTIRLGDLAKELGRDKSNLLRTVTRLKIPTHYMRDAESRNQLVRVFTPEEYSLILKEWNYE